MDDIQAPPIGNKKRSPKQGDGNCTILNSKALVLLIIKKDPLNEGTETLNGTDHLSFTALPYKKRSPK